MKINNPYLAWVRNRDDHDYFYLEANDDEYYFAWPAEQFGKTVAEQWLKFRGIISNEQELPEPRFRDGSALHIYLHNPTYNFVTFPPCELYINGIFPKLEEKKMKKLPIEERKVSTTFALSLKALEKLDEIQERNYPGKSRSYAMEEIISAIFNAWIAGQERTEVVPDDVSEVGYNPYTGAYEKGLAGAEKQKLSSIYGEVHNAKQDDSL